MSVTLTRIDVSAYRVPIAVPVETSFGVMSNRPAVFVRIEDADGAFGFGEIFANWPAAGAEHRARLLVEDMATLVVGRTFDGRSHLFDDLTRKTHIRALQCGEWGPFRQVIAGLDTAYIDLLARKAGLSVAQYLNAEAATGVDCYASGIAIAAAKAQRDESRDLGFTAFKVKVGFDTRRDARLLRDMFRSQADDEQLFADANQAWGRRDAGAFLDAIQDVSLGWLEEPLPADAPREDWDDLAQRSNIPLAGGENITGFDGFRAAIASGVFGVLQPDVAKWGGLSGCWSVANAVLASGTRYCPHFLGGGIGLIASAHLLAATGGDGLLEVDVNPNPLRDAFQPWDEGQDCGTLLIGNRPGLGIERMPEDIAQYRTYSHTLTAGD